VHNQQLLGLDVNNLAFSCYLHQKFFNYHLFRAGHSMNITPAAIPVVSGQATRTQKINNKMK